MSSSSSSYKQFAHLKIPLEEIVSATNNFSDENLIRESALKKAYKGKLLRSEEQIDIVADRSRHGENNDRFWKEISMLSDIEHKSVVSVFGLCDEKEEKIIIYKLKAKGTLNTFLRDPTLAWVQRLEICVGVMRALIELGYNFFDMQRQHSIIHGNISSSSILLDDNWEPKLFGFEHSVYEIGSTGSVHQDIPGRKGYINPKYEKTGMISFDLDVYSFGVVLFEVVCGRTAYDPAADDHWAKKGAYLFEMLCGISNKSTEQRPDGKLLGPLAELYYEAGKVDDLVDSGLLEQMDLKAFNIFSDIAYQCLKKAQGGRPYIYEIRNSLGEALDLQRKHEQLTKNLELLEIEFKDIESATDKFSKLNVIGSGGFGTVYKAVLKHNDNRNFMSLDKKKSTHDMPKTQSIVAIKCIKDEGGEEGFIAEIKMLGSCKHPNIVSLLGFCNEGSQKILVYEYVSRGSLDNYFERTNEMTNFKWEKRLQICLDIAQGLKYLHTKKKIIHRDIKSANILFDDNWVAKIADFGLSKFGPMNQELSYLKTLVAGTSVYLDPEYEKTNKLREASDIYSLGVVFFEIMSGTLAYDERYTKENEKGLAPFIRQREGTIKDILDTNVKEEIEENMFTPNKRPNQDSVDRFFGIAYKCLAITAAQRPNIETVVDKLEEAIHSQNNSRSENEISLGAIRSATYDFSEKNIIGKGECGWFYKGKATNADGSHTDFVVQRLDRGGEDTEFWTELKILRKYRHDNVIGLLGYCREFGEKIIVYEDASRGRLDTHLKDTDLTWKQRLQICIDVASGLYSLQGGGLTNEFVIHGDIKSSMILLNQDWKAKLCDFGYSVLTDKKSISLHIIKNTCCRRGHETDQSYKRFGLTKESDIFSFASLLIEISSGLLYYEIKDAPYDSLDEAQFKGIKEQIAPKSFNMFASLIDDCMNDELQERPTIGDVLQRIKQSLEFQVDYDIWKPKLPKDYEQIIQMSNSPEDYETKMEKDLYKMLLKGILLQESNVLFTLGDNGERNLMTSAKAFSDVNRSLCRWRNIPESRFHETAEMLDILNLNIEIKTRTQLLSSNVDYGIYLVFKFREPKITTSKPLYVNLKYKDGSKTSHAYFAIRRDNDWMMIELVRFLNDNEDKDFEFLLESFSQWHCGESSIYVEGIEFRPITHMKYEENVELEKVQQVLKLDSEMDMLQELPTNYLDILRSVEKDGGKEFYWLREVNENKHLMLAAKAALSNYCDVKLFETTPSTQSRFPEVIVLLPQQVLWINCAVKSRMLSRDVDYACYLVFKLLEKCPGLYCPIIVRELLHSTDKETDIVYFRSPSPWNLYHSDQTPKQRDDDWMEVRVWKFNLNHELEGDYLHVNLRLNSYEETMSDLIVCGLEFRPM